MGRRIPGRKHRGVRDPEQQRTQRLLKIKDKVNAPPLHADDQPIPKSVHRIADLMKKTENSSSYVKNKNTKKKKPSKKTKHLVRVHVKVGKDEKPIPKFEQKKGESDNAFMYRINQICESVKREAAFEKKYGVDVKRDSETGKVQEIVKRQKDPLELILKSVKREKKEKKRQKKKDSQSEEVARLTKSQKRQLKLKEKKKRKQTGNLDEFQNFSDTVKFGEIIHAPPNLIAPKKINKTVEKPRPGQKQLLLKSLIDKSGTEPKAKETVSKSATFTKGVTHKVIDKKGKRKDLPNGLRRQLDKQQKEIIDVYKSIKAQKRNRN